MSDGIEQPLPTVSIEKIKPEAVPPRKGDPASISESRKYSLTDLRNDRYALQTKHIENEHQLRKLGFIAIFTFSMCWMSTVVMLLCLQGCAAGHKDHPPFHLSEKEMLAVLGVTTANVLGVFLVAANYLFPKKPWWMRDAHPPRLSRKKQR